MAVETLYNHPIAAQADYRVLLDAMARPGHIGLFPDHPIDAPEPLHPATATIAFTLLDSAVTHFCAGFPASVSEFLSTHTGSPTAPALEADFLFLADCSHLEAASGAKLGDPAYPEHGATILLQVLRLSASSFPSSLALELTGPGVDGARLLHVSGLDSAFLTLLRTLNAEFPLGVDLILTSGVAFACIPRSQRLTWEPS